MLYFLVVKNEEPKVISKNEQKIVKRVPIPIHRRSMNSYKIDLIYASGLFIRLELKDRNSKSHGCNSYNSSLTHEASLNSKTSHVALLYTSHSTC